MRNLQVTAFTEISGNDEKSISATAWHVSDDSIICAFGPTLSTAAIELKRTVKKNSQIPQKGLSQDELFGSIASWTAPCPLPDLDHDEILLMHYFADIATTSIVLAGGDLILVREEPDADQEAIEIVGSIDVGIFAAAWAPDEEILALVTRTDNLVLMSKLLEPLAETQMTADDLGLSRHVSVGWGKKETQFQGKRAKAMRDPTMPEQVDEGKLSAYEDHAVSISWRGDGAFLAINSVVPDHRRVIRVYSREGVLDSVSEPVDGLESALSWRPAGNLIASVQRSHATTAQEKLQVVFFERNGLRHGEFDLRLESSLAIESSRKISLAWNIDSSVLAISFHDSVQFWTMGNYHYYLKQQIEAPPSLQKAPIAVRWHQEKPLKCLLQSGKSILDLELDLVVCRGSTASPMDHGTIAVIDGRHLKLTVMRQANIPPPMAFCEIDAESPVMDCALSPSSRQVAILTNSLLLLYDWKHSPARSNNSPQPIRFTNQLVLNQKHSIRDIFGGTRNCAKLRFSKEDKLYVLVPAQSGEQAQCIRINTDSPSASIDKIQVPQLSQNLPGDVRGLKVWASDGRVTVMIGQDEIAESSKPGFDHGHANKVMFQRLREGDAPDSDNVNRSFHQVYRTSKGALFIDHHLITRDCTSFVMTDNHLIFTTTQHLLKFVHLISEESIQIPDDAPDVDERCRTVERGAKIVTVIPSTCAVVLQMPRGNLETIYPRILVLAGVRKNLEAKEYLTAFLSCQFHQVDMNILYDHLPEVFMSNVPKFIDDLGKPSRIDEFISKLRDEDVTETLYKDTLKNLPGTVMDTPVFQSSKTVTATTSTNTTGKVNRICDALISTINTKGPRYLQNVITAHVCKRPPDLTAALLLVSSLKKSNSEEAEMAISHLCFLTDTNRLYDAALSLYDLELTLLVAQNAQRDPREYLPFLQSLQALPTLRRQYEIDNYLRQYRKAIVSLHSLQAHDELELYMTKHKLFTASMELYKYDTTRLPRITTLYAQYLETQSQYSSAAILYESLGEFSLAYPLYALAHQWRESLTCATLVPLDQAKILNLATSLATTCTEESRDFRSAASIFLDYLHDVPGAARLLSRGSYFAEASRILSLHNLRSEINTILDPGLTEKFGEIIELVSDCKSQLAAQVPRIEELRKKKAEDPLAFYGGDAAAMAADGVDIPDNVSLAPTDATTAGGQSLFTRYGSNASKFGGTVASNVSRKTSRTKRREERKRARGKKGSVYEEEYLISSVGRLIERVNGVQNEVRRLISGLWRRGLREQAAKVDEVMIEITNLCEKARQDVWQVQEFPSSADQDAAINSTYDVDGEGRPSGGDGVLWDSQQEIQATNTKQAPSVQKWSRSLHFVG